jgi:hypothetical protein
LQSTPSEPSICSSQPEKHGGKQKAPDRSDD